MNRQTRKKSHYHGNSKDEFNISILDDLKLFPECKTITNIWNYEKFEEYLHNVVQSSDHITYVAGTKFKFKLDIRNSNIQIYNSKVKLT